VLDHVTIRAADLDQARAFYTPAFELLDGPQLIESHWGLEWGDYSIAPATGHRPVTRRLHIAFTAKDRDQVDSWWQAMRDAGNPDLGAPGPRPEYSPSYYGAFIADPDGNNIEAVHHDHTRRGSGTIDHLWLRVSDLNAAAQFYATLAAVVGYELLKRQPGRVTLRRGGAPSFTLVHGEPTENVHLAFAASDNVTVDAFHQAGINAGYTSLGEPGERPHYHPGYYGAYLADPDFNNIEAVHHNRP
jgi:catechol 2,3-dioxygenase-like lactoylglutathione lyase family enzyme